MNSNISIKNTIGTLSNCIGNTPMIYIQSLSKITGCHIWGKAEFMNPGGSVKDRTALGIITTAEKNQTLKPGMCIIEGTAGNTGIGLAMIAASKGYKCKVVMPNNQSEEKYQILTAYNAEILKVPPCPFSDQNHFYHTARKISESEPEKYFWANQFENLANYEIHYQTTGPEIWNQLHDKIDIFCSSSGTGGSLGGISCFLKEKNKTISTVLIDPMGSGLYHYFHSKEMKSQGSSVTEGIGIMRLTENFKKALIDDALQIDDQKMISMLYHVAYNDGLLIGTSAGLNLYGAYELAKKNQNSGKNIVTLLCDSALRYQSKVFNPQWLKEKNLNATQTI